MSRVFVVIPVHNRKQFTKGCILSFCSQTFKDFRIVVVDDGSTDGTSEMLAQEFPQVTVLRGSGNLWWTGAINMGIKHCLEHSYKEDSVLIINDDLEVPADYLENLVEFSSEHRDALIGSVVVDIERPDEILFGGISINWWTAKQRILNLRKKLSEFGKSHFEESDYLTGRGTLVPIRMFREIGFYDDRHFKQCGDTELPVRASKNGYKLLVYYGAVIFSHEDGGDPINLLRTPKIGDIKRYFLGIKSNARLKYRFHFAHSALGRNYIRLTVYLLFDFVRLSYNFMRRISWQ